MKIDLLFGRSLGNMTSLILTIAALNLGMGSALSAPNQSLNLSINTVEKNKDKIIYNIEIGLGDRTSAEESSTSLESKMSRDFEKIMNQFDSTKGEGLTKGFDFTSSAWTVSLLKKGEKVETHFPSWDSFREIGGFFRNYYNAQLLLPKDERESSDFLLEHHKFMHFLKGDSVQFDRFLFCIIAAPNVLLNIPDLQISTVPNFLAAMDGFDAKRYCNTAYLPSAILVEDNIRAPEDQNLTPSEKRKDLTLFDPGKKYYPYYYLSRSICKLNSWDGADVLAFDDLIDAQWADEIPKDFDADKTPIFILYRSLSEQCNDFVASHILSHMDEILDWYAKNWHRIVPANKYQKGFIEDLLRRQKDSIFMTPEEMNAQIKRGLEGSASLANGFTQSQLDYKSLNQSLLSQYSTKFPNEMNPETQILSLFVGQLGSSSWAKEIIANNGDLAYHLRLLTKTLTKTCDDEFTTDYKGCLMGGTTAIMFGKSTFTMSVKFDGEPLFTKYRLIDE